MSDEARENTLRETITQAVESVEAATAAPTAPAEPAAPGPQTSSSSEVQAAAPAGDCPRDEAGRFAPKDSAPAGQEPKQPSTDPKAAQTPAAAELPAKPRPARPSSWKKEMWDHWEKLDPNVAEYILSREGDYAKGVSTYKSEWDKAKPLVDAVAPFAAELQQWKIDPAQQIGRYLNIHRTLSLGTPEQKLATFLKVAQDYNVPVQQLFVRGQDGQVYYNPQVQQAQAAPQQQQASQQQPDIQKIVQQELSQREALRSAKEFVEAKDATGNLVHPHYEIVRDTMAQLLEAGLADDIPSAYEAAVRHPRHADIYEAQQKQQAAKDDAERQRKAKEAAEAARRNAVSTRSSTPASQSAPGGKKGLRATLEDAVDQHTAGRV